MPKLLLITTDDNLAEKLSKLLAACEFSMIQAADLTDHSHQADLVIFAPKQTSETEYKLFETHPLQSTADWILLSDGLPNKWLDMMMTQGIAYHFRQMKDFSPLVEIAQEFAEEFKQLRKNRQTATLSSSLDQYGSLLGSSAVMHKLYRLIRRVSQTDANVFLIGESGCGKEVAARTIHEQSERANEPMVSVNCAALAADLVESELFGHEKGAFTGAVNQHIGFFEQGGNGTLLLDEITEMPLALQSKLLRVLESGEFRRVGSDVVRQSKVRVIAATNREPEEAIEAGFLREDLYFRLAHFPIKLPPLRHRDNDVIELAKHFLAYRNEATNTGKVFADEVLEIFAQYSWPGNVRELKHCVERAHILAEEVITVSDLPDFSTIQLASIGEIGPGTSIKEAEKSLILSTLDACKQNKTQAAKQLGITVKTLYNKLEQYGQIEPTLHIGSEVN
ncbi:sigma-54 interaction domain-containing protein [Methylophaga sp.]|uniref:sigma-54 interaction domain-containing protein n=1 Tax=Methylophaga sp. TaxID=2024840 RepID=UPI003A93A16D